MRRLNPAASLTLTPTPTLTFAVALAMALAAARPAGAADVVPVNHATGATTLLVRFDEPTRLSDVEVAAAGAVLRLPAGDAWGEPIAPAAPGPGAAGARTRFALADHPPLTLLRVDLPAGAEVPPGAPVVVPHEAPRAVLAQLPALTEAVTKLQPIERLPRFWASYPVAAPLAAPGDVVRLPLPPALFVVPGIGPGNVRPLQADRVIPFTLLAAATLLKVDGRVTPRDGGLEVELPPFAPQLTQLELVGPAGATIDARVEVDYLAVKRPGLAAEAQPGPRVAWRCADPAAGPCLAFVPLAPPPGASALEVRFAPDGAGGAAPAAGVAARLWAPESALLFAWPAGGDVRLVSGFDPVREDAPQVREVRAQLTSRPTRDGTVDPTATAEESERLAARSPWIVGASFLVAAVLLALVVGRSLRRSRRRT